MILDLRRPAITALRLGRRRAVTKRQLPPPDRARRAHPEPLGCAAAQYPSLDSSNDTIPQIT